VIFLGRHCGKTLRRLRTGNYRCDVCRQGFRSNGERMDKGYKKRRRRVHTSSTRIRETR
jgi:hypothetical protein